MPIYEYTCEKCGHTTEALRRVGDADKAINCDRCASPKTRRAHSVFQPGPSSAPSNLGPPASCTRCGDPNGPCGG